MRILSASLSAVFVLVLGGCGESDPTDETPEAAPTTSATTAGPDPTPTSATPEPEPEVEVEVDPAARTELRRAIKALVRSNTGTYRLELGDGQERGTYQVAPRAFELRRYLPAEEGTFTVDYRAVGPSSWMRAVDAPVEPRSWPCWIATADLADGADPGLGQLLTSELATTQPPNALVAATYGTGRAYSKATPGQVLGTIDLLAATSLLGSQVGARLGLDPANTATTPASFDLEGGRLVGYSVQAKDLVESLVAEGVDLPVSEGQLVAGVVRVTFDDLGAAVDIVAPDPSEVVEIVPGKADFKDEMAACGDALP